MATMRCKQYALLRPIHLATNLTASPSSKKTAWSKNTVPPFLQLCNDAYKHYIKKL